MTPEDGRAQIEGMDADQRAEVSPDWLARARAADAAGPAALGRGGTLVGARDSAPGQRRASSVQGGETHHLTKGDVITIPAKTPHWFKEVPTQTIAYYAVNTEQ